ncbi:MAG: peptidylprolyl isomerase [Phycisphaerae bacterium]
MKKVSVILFVLLFFCVAQAGNPRVVLRTIFIGGDIVIELYPEEAPITVQNFLNYVESGFYDWIVFHRAISDFMVQGGSYQWAYSNYPYLKHRTPVEPIPNESSNGLLNLRGTIAMALLSDESGNVLPDSATSGFYINQVHSHWLDGIHCVFGDVLYGMDFIDWIAVLNKMELPGVGNTVPYYGNYESPYFIMIYKAIVIPEADQLKADINYNGIVDEQDLRLISENWLSSAELGDMEVIGNVNFEEFANFAKSWNRTSVWYREITADIDNNKRVDFKDFALFAQDWDKNGTELYGDLNLDKTVNLDDLNLFVENWLKSTD